MKIGKLKTIILSIFFLTTLFVVLEISKGDVSAMICGTNYYCTTSNQWVNSYVRIGGGSCHYITYYSCNGNDTNCQEDYVDIYSDAECAVKTHDDYGCCIYDSPPACNNCTPSSPPACPAGTTETNTGDFHSSTTSSCDRGSGCDPRYNTSTRNCYCSLCTPPSCTPTYSTTNLGFGSISLSCQNSPTGDSRCDYRSNTCYCYQCTPANCPADLSNTDLGVGVSTHTVSCTNACSSSNSRACYCRDCTLPVPSGTTLTNTGRQSTDPTYQSTSCSKGTGCTPKSAPLYCTRCTPTACGPTYATSNQGYGTLNFTCNNTLASCGTETRACYCYSCTPPACAPTYSTTNYGYGSVTLSCTNACSTTSNRTCYIDRCSNCTLPNCPSPLTNTPTTADPNMELTNFRSCTRSAPCGGPANYGACYEVVSPQPTTSLQIYPDAANVYNFSSSTHTGTRTPLYNLNDPIPMTATYTDVNGATDIEAVSVWFRDESLSGEINTPLVFMETGGPSVPAPQTETNNSWGFMMRWNGSTWLPYVPSYPSAPSTPAWVPALYASNSFVISGPNGLQMVRVTIGHSLQSNITRSGNNVVLPFQLSFNFSSGYDSVAQVDYQTYLMGNDVFSFTPSDNYAFSVEGYWQGGQLRYRTSQLPAQLYARQWALTGYTWSVDKDVPEVEDLTMTVIGDTTLRLSWNVTDSREIYAVVGNIYASISMPPNPDDLVITGTGLDVNSPHQLITDTTDLAKLNTGYAFRGLNIGGTTYTNNVTIDIGSNIEGSLVVYLTAFDMAGNMSTRSLTYSLGDWIATYGGFVYSSEGRDYEMKTIESDTAWDSVPVLAGLDPTLADVSTELFADNQSSGTLPSALDRSTELRSYHMRPFSVNVEMDSLYQELKQAYNDREIEGKVDLTLDLPMITSLNGNLSDIGSCTDSSRVCILKRQGDLDVGNVSTFNCDQWGVFFVEGNLTISRNIVNANPSYDACIFVVGGEVLIEDGQAHSNALLIGYDQINAYIMADGAVNIQAELGAAAKYDGVFVGGGLHSLTGINMDRSLKLADRNIYPALLVKYHPKYSVLSNLVFGSQIDILKTELGFKPY